MIKQLTLKNYILIDELTANFDKGLNIITGETGAGKSILINAIDLIFSSRVQKDVIKTGCDKALIEIVLENKSHNLTDLFEEYGIDNFGEEIILSKEITTNSVRPRINGTLVNQEIFKKLKDLFVDIHSQHQTYIFMQPSQHIKLLDSYAKDIYGEELSEYRQKFSNYTELKQKLEELKSKATATESQIEFLKFQINEIESAQIKSENEDEELTQELDILNNAEKLKELTGNAYWAINGDDGSIIETIMKIKSDLNKAASYDNSLEEINSQFSQTAETLREISRDLNNYSQNLSNDTERLNTIQERLFNLDKLKRKYGGTLESVLKSYQEISNELESIEYSNENIENLEQEIIKTESDLKNIANKISEARQDYAKVLSVLVEDKLKELELPKARFEISVGQSENFGPNGTDNVEFLISTNVSEELKPLAKVASGGEISRVMLAIKSIFAQNDEIDTVIFDEIDTGISGHASQSVAQELVNLSKTHQIIVITHQAIIASKADKHFYVRKSQQDSTIVEVFVIEGANRIKALAELAGGEINEQSVEFAKSLLGS